MSDLISDKTVRFAIIALSVLCLNFSLFSSVEAALVNINIAGLEELKTLTGIGDVKAQAIITYRNTNGLFAKIEDIKNVSGIGDSTYAAIKDSITVGEVATPPPSPTPPPSSINQEQTPGSSTSSSNKSVWLTQNKSTKYEVEIESEEVAAVGTPLEFKVETNFGVNKSSIFEWKFGDGSQGYGPEVTHTYTFPGEYVVVLNVKVPDTTIVSRANIKIISPVLAISYANPERIEIANNSSDEVDLFGRTLWSGGEMFAFPEDTIILAGQKISFSSAVTGLVPRDLSEVYLMTVGDNPNLSVNGVLKFEEMRLKSVAKIESELSELKNKLASVSQYRSVASVAKVQVPSPVTVEVDTPEPEESLDETALTANVISATNSSSWFDKLKRFFLRTK